MHTIFIIDDHLSHAKNAAVLAFRLAKNTRAKIVLGTFKSMVSEPAARMYLNTLNENDENCGCSIEELEIGHMTIDCLAGFINQNQTLMVIKSTTAGEGSGQQAKVFFNMHALLNKVFAPVCLIPAEWEARSLKRIAYITDLRYCRTDILSHLFKFITPEAAVYIAHMAVPGVADLAPQFAIRLFKNLTAKLNGRRLSLHHIKETASTTVADVLVNGMNNDALIFTNRSAHFSQLVGNGFDMKHPELIQVPLLLYPT
jgi:hypothetical protein